ncbi:hypothetical protein ALC53_01572 [Atta colombica]|uniref:Uncharacterized protein n=1 Tax=Atta colombica TaxID=520822 RepID=A0A195BV02_9HYME|nr:hypothetical protein ALC53_01572 [Atta colombica]
MSKDSAMPGKTDNADADYYIPCRPIHSSTRVCVHAGLPTCVYEAGEEEKAKVQHAGLVERDDGAVLSHKELGRALNAMRSDVVHRVDSVGTERRVGIVYCVSSINPPPSPISSRIHPASLMQSANMSQVRPRGVERLSVKSRHRAVSAKRGRVCFTNRGRVLAKNKRLSKRRGTTVREGDAIQHDTTRRSRKHTKRVAQESRRWKKERDVEKEGRQVRQRTKAENDRLKKKNEERGRGRESEKEKERRRVYKERVQTRQLRTRPKTAIKSRDKQTTNPFCPPEEGGPATIVLTIVGTPSHDFSADTEDEESSSLFLRHHYHHCCCCRCSSSSRALSQLSSSSRVVFCQDSPCL